MLDSFYHMPFNYLQIAFLALKRQDFAIFKQGYNGRHYVTLLNL